MRSVHEKWLDAPWHYDALNCWQSQGRQQRLCLHGRPTGWLTLQAAGPALGRGHYGLTPRAACSLTAPPPLSPKGFPHPKFPNTPAPPCVLSVTFCPHVSAGLLPHFIQVSVQMSPGLSMPAKCHPPIYWPIYPVLVTLFTVWCYGLCSLVTVMLPNRITAQPWGQHAGRWQHQ